MNLKCCVKPMAVLLFLLVPTKALLGDYSSLTKKEKTKVRKAFKQAKYYKYYLSLVEGEDKIKIVDVKLVSQEHLDDDIIRSHYLLTVDLIIHQTKFRREAEWYSDTEVLLSSDKKKTRWKRYLREAAKYASGFALGLIFGWFGAR